MWRPFEVNSGRQSRADSRRRRTAPQGWTLEGSRGLAGPCYAHPVSWTPWKKIADRVYWYTDHLMRISVCYELSLIDPSSSSEPRTVHAGAAVSERKQILAWESGEDPLSERIQAELKSGLELYYRAEGAPTLEAAQDLLAKARAERSHTWDCV